MCLWWIYIFPGSVPIFAYSRIGRLIVGIYKSLTETWMWKLGLKAAKLIFWEYLFRIFGIESLQCSSPPPPTPPAHGFRDRMRTHSECGCRSERALSIESSNILVSSRLFHITLQNALKGYRRRWGFSGPIHVRVDKTRMSFKKFCVSIIWIYSTYWRVGNFFGAWQIFMVKKYKYSGS
jgi:hypothetical protein